MKLVATFTFLALSLGRALPAQDTSALRGVMDRNLQQSFAVESLQLVNANTNAVIATLTMDATINVPSNTPLNIKAEVTGSGVRSVQFGYGSIGNFLVESSPPYAFCGNKGVAYNPCAQLIAGTHTVTATPFSGVRASGSAGTPYTIKFSIVFRGSVPVPTPVSLPAVPVMVAPLPSPLGFSQTHSAWLPAVETPVVAAAAAHLPDGRILMWSSKSRTNFGVHPSIQTWTAIYNPATEGMTEELVVSTKHDMFCPGTTVLPNGVIMISGGANSNATTFYDYRDNKWSIGPQMNIPRGYQAHTLLTTGEVFSFGGSWSGGSRPKDGEIWSPQTNSWRRLPGVPSKFARTADKGGNYRSDNHYWLFVAPNGKVFHAGPSKQMHWITTSGNGSIQASIQRGDDNDAMNGNAVMYDIGKILTVGGAMNYAEGAASKKAFIIDINGSEATVKRTRNDMQFARSLLNSVVLPNGEVVVIGGMASVKLFSDDTAILEAEIWNPITETFKTLKPMRVPRTYHSVALIMKDGRVWAAGGGLCNCKVNHMDFEILTPPYLFNTDGSPATRPSIQKFPATAKAGDVITVGMDSDGSHTFALIKASAVTHSVNNDQRRLPLELVSQSGSLFSLKITDNKNVALRGYYFLFALNAQGVPSVGETVRIDH